MPPSFKHSPYCFYLAEVDTIVKNITTIISHSSKNKMCFFLLFTFFKNFVKIAQVVHDCT